MNTRRRLARLVLIASCVCAALVSNIVAVAHAQSPLSDTFHKLLVSEYAATIAGDTATLGRLVADDAVWFLGANGAIMGKGDLLKITAQNYPQPQAPRFDVDSVHATRFGNVATVDYLRNDTWPMGDSVSRNSYRALDVFVMHEGRWQLERHTQVWLKAPITAIALDSTSMNAFVGRYRIGPGYVDNVHWEGKHLVATSSGQSVGAELVPVSATAFSPDGTGVVIVFERDANGRVLGYVQAFPDGSVRLAERLP